MRARSLTPQISRPQKGYQARTVLPAGMSPKRTTDSLSLYSDALGTEHGNVHSYVPGNERLRKWYHFDDDAYKR